MRRGEVTEVDLWLLRGADWCTEKYTICVLIHAFIFFLSIYTVHLYVQVINLFTNYDAGVTAQNVSPFIYVGS